MNGADIIRDARTIEPEFDSIQDRYDSELTAALDTVALNGFYDDMLGDVSDFGLFYLIGRFVLRVTEESGLSVFEFASVEAAESEWRELEREYDEWEMLAS